ncbi:MAG: type VI secretion system baseplate subunit TssF [Campylobacteraceae bacterium]|nr:type VI secretion system baseplate subunit TssF [Campylobacteraceae bacterium]
MEFNDYYRNELNALREDGAEFSKKNPGLSTYLSKPGQDPDVERLLEGFAFLTARLQQQMDKELPEVAHTLVQLLWPNYVRAIPSYCIVKYDALKNSVNNEIVQRDTNLLSSKNSLETKVRFRTCYETEVLALNLNEVEYIQNGKESSLCMNLNMSTKGSLFDMSFDKLRVFLAGSKFISKDIYLLMNQYVKSIEINILDDEDEILDTVNINKNSIEPVGFSSNEKLAPYPLNVFDGYILLQEYFCYPDKFLFVDICNLNQIKSLSEDILQKSRKISIQINFSSKLSSNEIPKTSDFALYCTPAINIFQSDAVPIRKDETIDEYLIVPSDIKKEHSEVFSVQSVRGWIAKKNIYDTYSLFESFDHGDSEYYSLRVKLSSSGEDLKTYMRFSSNDGLYEDVNSSSAIVSVDILCTNKNYANNNLLLNDLSQTDPLSASAHLKFNNITIPSPSYVPPISGDFLWQIVSNMSLNYLSLNNVEALRTIIATYDFVGANDIKQKENTSMILSGIKNISYKSAEMMDKGLPIRGIEITLLIDASKFSSLGDVYMFCSVLNEFLSLYGNINSFHKLIVDVENQDTFTWKHKLGSRSII